MENKIIADVYETTTYVLWGITYLPHYNEAGVYVSPGYGSHNFKEYTAKELLNAGAVVKKELLFSRSW